MQIECWQRGKLIARHTCSDALTTKEILVRFGLNERWTVMRHPDGRPDLIRTIQTELAYA